jgi:hypothetical protein
MKKIAQYLIAASLFVACNSKSDLDTNKDVVLTDTTGMYKSNMTTDTGSVIETTALTDANRNTAVANTRAANTNRTTTAPRNSSNRVSSTTSSSNAGSGQTTTVTRKKGWSHAAKNAVIGGVGGAVVGAVVSKKKGKGAVIGGVLGAAGGYILGRSKDKKEGR